MSIIEEIAAKVDDWKGKEISIQQLSGGLTNTNYKITVDGKPYFVRVPGESTELLAIDRNNEYHNTQAAANAGVAPKVLNYFPQHNVMIWNSSMAKPCRRIHSTSLGCPRAWLTPSSDSTPVNAS